MIASVGLPTCMEGMMYPVPFATPQDLVTIAKTAEELGYHSVWGNDHMTTQKYVREGFRDPPNFYEILVTYAFVAAATRTLRFGTGMLVTPMRRDIVVTAKQIATLDLFSQGRLILGIGVGAYREEFQALNPGVNAQRGDMVEESIEALQLLFRERRCSFKGRYYQFQDVEMYPKPCQKPLPLYIGGNSPQAMERTVRHAQGWMPAALPADEIRRRVSRLKSVCDAAGRDYRQIDVAPQYMVCIGKTRQQAVQQFRDSQMYHHVMSLTKSTLKDQDLTNPEDLNLIGTSAEVLERALELQDAGVTHLCGMYFVGNTVDGVLEQMHAFAQLVMPKLQQQEARG